MALEDLALFRSVPDCVVLYPRLVVKSVFRFLTKYFSDAVSTEYAVELVSNVHGIAFIRTGRPAVPVLYDNNEKFEIGKAKVCDLMETRSLIIPLPGSETIQGR